MIEIYDIPTAQKTILKRQPLSAMEYPAVVLKRTEDLFGAGVTPPQAVAQILASVRLEGDAALRRWSKLLDKVDLTDFRIPPERLEEARRSLDPALLDAMCTAAERIREFHKLQPIPNWESTALGGRLGQRFTPVECVGIYVPGGTAPLPSSLLMSVIPAQVAGVERIIVCTPPLRPQTVDGGQQATVNGQWSTVSPVILVAASICGVDEIYQIGGAQAIAAMTFGSESVPRVDKIVGAGNLFVTLAKQQVYGIVGLDGLAGPTETAVIADGAANPTWVAADLLAQAEHDILASAILFTPDESLAKAVQTEAIRQTASLSRSAIIAQSLEERSGIVITPDLATAAALASEYAPEHLCIATQEPQSVAALVRNAGGLFIGEHSFEVLGDYIAGPSHIMPTGGTARFASPLNVLDFVKLTSIVALDVETCKSLSPLAAKIARAEGLTAHAAAAEFRAPLPSSHFARSSAQNGGTTGGLIRPHIQDMPAYEPILPFEVLSRQLGRAPEEIIKLDANENPYGALLVVRAALAAMPYAHVYPDPGSQDLRAALARCHNLPVENILAGAGADELIDLILRLVIDPGDAVLNCPPTFGMYAFDGDLNAARVISIPRREDFSLDVNSIERAVRDYKPKVLFLASPNNPDGNLIPREILMRLLELPLLMVLDEAYIEFSETQSLITEVPNYRNLIVLRTFSKWAGLAGLRVGFGVFPSALMPHLWKIKQPYNVSVAASTAAIASLEHADELFGTVRRIIVERERLFNLLQGVPWLKPYPSRANFILCRVEGRDAAQLKKDLAAQGILVRYFDKPGLQNCIRISVGRPEHTEALLAAFRVLPAGKS